MSGPARHRLDASFHLLDRQIVGADGALAGKVDDLELVHRDDDPTGPPYVAAILSRPWFRSTESIDFGTVKRVGVDVEVARPSGDLPVGRAEARVWERLVVRLPGGSRHARG
jgi:hypothetical protein